MVAGEHLSVLQIQTSASDMGLYVSLSYSSDITSRMSASVWERGYLTFLINLSVSGWVCPPPSFMDRSQETVSMVSSPRRHLAYVEIAPTTSQLRDHMETSDN